MPHSARANCSISGAGTGWRCVSAARPCCNALRLAVDLPAAVRGPQLLRLLRRLASILRTEVITRPRFPTTSWKRQEPQRLRRSRDNRRRIAHGRQIVMFIRLLGEDAWAEFAAVFSRTRSAHLEHEQAKAELKGLMPEDAKEAIGHGIRAKRSKSGAVSFDLLDVEGGRA